MGTLQEIKIQVIYSDDDIIVVVKPAGVPTQSDLTGDPDLMGLVTASWGKVWLVHRLDRVVGGLVVFARTAAAAAALSRAVQANGNFEKSYVALIPGIVEGSGAYRDLLFHDKRAHRSFVVDRPRTGVKEALLQWTSLAHGSIMSSEVTMVGVSLETGRFHQIRVQFASRKTPLLGDGKYGSRVKCPLALYAYRLSFLHPTTGRRLEFLSMPPNSMPWEPFENVLQSLMNTTENK